MAALGVGLVLVAGCGQLPTPDTVRTVRRVAADAPDVGAPEVRKLPAGPLPGEQPADVVRGFIAAAADPSARHALSRSFLARGVKWDDAESLVVYDPSSVDDDGLQCRTGPGSGHAPVGDGAGGRPGRWLPAVAHDHHTPVRRHPQRRSMASGGGAGRRSGDVAGRGSQLSRGPALCDLGHRRHARPRPGVAGHRPPGAADDGDACAVAFTDGLVVLRGRDGPARRTRP